MTTAAAVEGDALPPRCEVIEVRVGSIEQLFKAIDPSPFRTRDLRTDVEEFIVDWAREVPRHAPLALRVHTDGPPGSGDSVDDLREAVRSFFQNRAESTHRRLRMLLRMGRIRAEGRLLRRLTAMPVRIRYPGGEAAPG